MNDSFGISGFKICRGVIDGATLDLLRDHLDSRPSRLRGGARNLLRDSSVVAALASAGPLLSLANQRLVASAFPVRALYFDKTAVANWKVPWHQDTTIAVAGRIETPGFTGWSVKDGVPHVHAPAPVLDRMVTLRLHLDDCGPENGPLRVLPASHRAGFLDDAEIQRWRKTSPETVCVCRAGDALMMKPLLLHASSPAMQPARRRVLHIEYAATALPGGLRWHAARSVG